MKLQNDFLDALLKETAIRRDYLEGEEVETIYFGGGTPSLLDEGKIARVMDALHAQFAVSANAEITFEANPDDITKEALHGWRRTGVNRLSIGIQSFFAEDLAWMNRAHDAQQAFECITLARNAGFSNFSIDLIYGTPTLPDENWQYNLMAAADLMIPHLSCYALTVEPGTALDSMTRKKKVAAVTSEDQARQFLMMTDYLQSRGYEHYEISNLALPGRKSIHNSSYWSGRKYLGLGPSAHSFNGASRQWNVSNNALYISSLAKNQVPFEIETLTTVQRLNEYIMTSIRTMEGMDLEYIEKKFGEHFINSIRNEAAHFIEKKWMIELNNKLVLTREGKLFGDGIASGLFVSESVNGEW